MLTSWPTKWAAQWRPSRGAAIGPYRRLKPHALDVKTPVNPVHWFLNGKDDVRSSYYLEDVATEFHIQGLEVDWACVVWNADFRFTPQGWQHWSFRGNGGQRILAQ